VPGERIEELPVDKLRFGLSPRMEATDPQHVAALAEVLSDVPPILVQASTMRVIDGVHRVLAARSIGQTTIRAVIFEGDEIGAHIEAVHRNVRHGKPLTLAEREAAANKFIELVPEWSDRRIATVSGISPKTVARLRERASVDSAQLRARVGRDGRVRAVDSSEVRRRVVAALLEDPDASTRAIARLTRASQATVRDVRERLARGENGLLSVVEPKRKRRAPAADPEGGPGGGPDAAKVVSDEFADWFAARDLEDADWQRYVDAIPISRVYEVADRCRRRGESWRAFATALEDRARTHKRDTSTG
jgi:ParB-like chromosome segregation protein Spo0J